VKFGIHIVLSVEEDNNNLSTFPDAHAEDVECLIRDALYDIDDTKVVSIRVSKLED